MKLLLQMLFLVVSLEASGQGVVVCGGTSGSVTAAVESARLGRKTVLVEPGRHLGGLSRDSPAYWEQHAAANSNCSGDNVRAVIRNFVRAAK